MRSPGDCPLTLTSACSSVSADLMLTFSLSPTVLWALLTFLFPQVLQAA